MTGSIGRAMRMRVSPSPLTASGRYASGGSPDAVEFCSPYERIAGTPLCRASEVSTGEVAPTTSCKRARCGGRPPVTATSIVARVGQPMQRRPGPRHAAHVAGMSCDRAGTSVEGTSPRWRSDEPCSSPSPGAAPRNLARRRRQVLRVVRRRRRRTRRVQGRHPQHRRPTSRPLVGTCLI